MIRTTSHLLAGGLLGWLPHATAQSVPTDFLIESVVTTGLQAPIDLTFLPDGRMLIANRAGAVSVFAGGNATTVGTVPQVESGGERGLLSIAADPSFASNGYIYVYYSSSADSFLHLERFTCTGDLANPASSNLTFAGTSRRVILSSLPDFAFNHNGGSCRFGPDGRLYLTVGDDASSCTAQSLTSKRGCLLRMDVNGLGATPSTVEPAYSLLDPTDNPNSGSAGFERLVLANGLRNPFRMEIDQATGNCYIGDVGQSSSEEYSEYVYGAGALPLANFGWPWLEGFGSQSSCGGTAPTGMLAPIAAVTSSTWNSIMGGPRYRNQGGPDDFGPAYEGDCFFLDFYAGDLRRITFSNGSWQPAAAVAGQVGANWGTGFVGVTALRQGPDGALYFCKNTSTSPTSGGRIDRIRPLGPVNSVLAISGGGQVQPAGETFPQPLVAQVLDSNGQPLPFGTINFAVNGGNQLSTTNPVTADANGFAQTAVTSNPNTGGSITVTATTPNSPFDATFNLFARKLTATGIPGATTTLLVLSATNTTQAQPAQIPYIVLMSFPGSPVLPTPIGPICTDPGYPLTVVLEDGTGAFGGVSFSGSGAIGTPSKTWLYQGIPSWLLQGQLIHFQAVGFDPITGWFRTNCEAEQF